MKKELIKRFVKTDKLKMLLKHYTINSRSGNVGSTNWNKKFYSTTQLKGEQNMKLPIIMNKEQNMNTIRTTLINSLKLNSDNNNEKKSFHHISSSNLLTIHPPCDKLY